MLMVRTRTAGFTIVELAVVIAVIGILSAIGIVSFRTYKADTEVATMKKDMLALKLSIEKYYAKNGSYPLGSQGSGAWSRRAQHGEGFIAGIFPEYLKVVPDVESGVKTDLGSNTYLYISNGADYKLIRLVGVAQGSLSPHERSSIEPALQDPVRWSGSTPQYRAWGYWSPGGRNW